METFRYYYFVTVFGLFGLIRDVLLIIDGVIEKVSNVSFFYGWRYERDSAFRNGKFAHKVKIIMRKSPSLSNGYLPSYDNFIWKHSSYEKAELLLENEHASLFGVCERYAIFCLTDSSIDVWDASVNPFAILAQWTHAKELIFLPIDEFHRIAEKVNVTNCKLTFLLSIARTGSTLLAKMLHSIPNIRMLAEAWSPAHIHIMHQAAILTDEEKRRYLESAIKLLCFRFGTCVIKPAGCECGNAEDYAALFPDATLIFNCRAPWPCVKSREVALQKTISTSSAIFPYAHNLPFPSIGSSTDKIDQFRSFIRNNTEAWKYKGQDAAAFYALCIWHYLRNKERFSHVICYEDLDENPRREILTLLAKMTMNDISKEQLSKCVRVMDKDSQIGYYERCSKQPPRSDLAYLRKAINKAFDIFDINLNDASSVGDLKEILK